MTTETKFVSKHRAELLIPRPFKGHADRTGRLSIYMIWKSIDETFIKAQKEGFFQINLHNTGFTTFLVRARALYSPKMSTQMSHILSRISIGNVGTTSVSYIQEFLDPSTKEVLMRAEYTDVLIDQSSRRPSELPKWCVEMYSMHPKVESPSKLLKREPLIPPDNAFRTKILTRFSDTDTNGHVNYAEYYQFCAECASEASLSSYYRHYDDDMCWFPVLDTDATFLGESLPCVELDVFTWQDPDKVQRIYFTIYKKQSKIFQACYLYGLKKIYDSKL